MAWESPRGPMSIDPETRDVVQTVYMRRVEKVGDRLVNVEFDKIENVKDPVKARAKNVRGSHIRGQARHDRSAVGVLFDGFAYGMLLFLLSVGLSVTLGMMNFVNLAHCSFAMLGGYVTVTLTNSLGWPFLATLPLAFIAAAVVSVVFERLLYRRLYRATDLDQCLLTIGIVFISVAIAAYVLRHDPAAGDAAVLSARHGHDLGAELRRLPAVPDRHVAAGDARAGAVARIHPVRRQGARRGRQPAHGARARHQRRSPSSR